MGLRWSTAPLWSTDRTTTSVGWCSASIQSPDVLSGTGWWNSVAVFPDRCDCRTYLRRWANRSGPPNVR